MSGNRSITCDFEDSTVLVIGMNDFLMVLVPMMNNCAHKCSVGICCIHLSLRPSMVLNKR